MKKAMFLSILILVLASCEKNETTQPPVQPPSEECIICRDTMTGQQAPEMCDDTLTIRVWMEWYQFQNDNNGAHWVCLKQKK